MEITASNSSLDVVIVIVITNQTTLQRVDDITTKDFPVSAPFFQSDDTITSFSAMKEKIRKEYNRKLRLVLKT